MRERASPVQYRPEPTSLPAWWIMVPILLLTAWLTVGHFTHDLLWVDEVLTYHGSGGAQYGPMSIWGIIHHAIYYDAYWPPFYFSTIHFWGSVAGWTPFAGRYLSLLFGCMVVALVYRFGREFHSAEAGTFAALILSTSAFFSFYLHEYRGYTLHLLCAMLALWFYGRIMTDDRPAPRRLRATFVLSIAGLLYSHSFGMPVAAALGLYHLLVARRNPQWSNTLRLMILGGLLFLPWFSIPTIAALIAEHQNPRTMSLATLATTAARTFGNGLPLLLIAVASFAALRLRHRCAGQLAFIVGTVAGLALALNAVFRYLFHIRHLLVLMPLVALLLAMTLVELRRLRPVAAYAVLALWIAAGIYHVENRAFMEQQPGALETIPAAAFHEVLQVIRANCSPEDAIFFQIGARDHERFNHVVLDFYLDTTDLRYAQIGGIKYDKSESEERSYARKFDDFVDGASAIWAITMPGHFPPDELAPFLAELHTRGYRSCGTVFPNTDFVIDSYRKDGCDHPQSRLVPTADASRLT